MRPSLLVCLGLGLLLLAGCSGMGTQPAPTDKPLAVPATWMGTVGAVERATDARWHTSCFQMPFGSDGSPVWAMDLLLADRVIAPVLRTHATDIALWRFHRRAAPDETGHAFSVLLYVSDASFARITAAIDADPLVTRLLREGRIKKVNHGCRASQSRADIAATSDPAWDGAVERSWPYFIMGVSASWLALVHDLASTAPPGDDLLADYAAIDRRIGELWAAEGQHAYLHHLSGIYGYRPLRIQTFMQY